MGVKVTWDIVPGALHYDVRNRIKGASDWDVAGVNVNRYDTTFTAAGIEWEYQVRTSRGERDPEDKGSWSAIYSAKALRNSAPGGRNIKTTPSPTSVLVSWQPPAGTWDVDRYEVGFWDRTATGVFPGSQATRALSTTIGALVQGHRYEIWVSTWARINGELAGGLPEFARPIIAGPAVTPPAVSNLQVKNTDPTTAQLSWAASSGAAGYLVYTQNINNATDTSKTDGVVLAETQKGIAYMFPGTWNYEICITAINGNFESQKKCIIPPKYPGF